MEYERIPQVPAEQAEVAQVETICQTCGSVVLRAAAPQLSRESQGEVPTSETSGPQKAPDTPGCELDLPPPRLRLVSRLAKSITRSAAVKGQKKALKRFEKKGVDGFHHVKSAETSAVGMRSAKKPTRSK